MKEIQIEGEAKNIQDSEEVLQRDLQNKPQMKIKTQCPCIAL